MKTTITIDLAPFNVPTYLHTKKLAQSPPPVAPPINSIEIDNRKFHLSEIPTDTLEQLCDEFKIAVFNKAGKAIPPTRKD